MDKFLDEEPHTNGWKIELKEPPLMEVGSGPADETIILDRFGLCPQPRRSIHASLIIGSYYTPRFGHALASKHQQQEPGGQLLQFADVWRQSETGVCQRQKP
jgi:hypothetical protein